MGYNFIDNQMNIIQTEAKQALNHIRAESAYDMKIKSFIELERKKYKRDDDLEDMIRRQ